VNIAVYLGGISAEREVSLITGKVIGKALEQSGHSVLYVDPALGPESITNSIPDDLIIDNVPPEQGDMDRYNRQNLFHLLMDDRLVSSDFHFIGLHGGIGENGILQGLFEYLDYPFNGPGYSASALAMDKHLSKQIMAAQEIPTPEWLIVEAEQWSAEPEKVRSFIEEKFTPPIVVKPNSQGSTIGLSVLSRLDELDEALDKAVLYDHRILIEKFIPGKEMTAAVLGDEVLPLIMIVPKEGLYDYESKYADHSTEYVVPAPIDRETTRLIQEYALRLFRSIGASGYSRVDFRVTEAGEPFCLELNTLPGMTDTSLVPKAAGAAGIPFEKLLERIIQLGQNS